LSEFPYRVCQSSEDGIQWRRLMTGRIGDTKQQMGADDIPFADRLSTVSLFSGLGAAELQSLAARVRRAAFVPDEAIFHQGEQGASLYVILTGLVRITQTTERGERTALVQLGPGEFFGELSLFDGGPHAAT